MRILYFFVFLTMSIGAVIAQDNSSLKNDSWVRYENLKKDFSVALPPNTIVNIDESIYRLYAYENGVRISVSFEENSSAKKDLRTRISYIKDREKYFFFQTDDFIGFQYAPEKKDEDEFYHAEINLASSNGKFNIILDSREPPKGNFARVLSSIKLSGKSVYAQTNAPADTPFAEEKAISVAALKTSQIVLDALNQKDGNLPKLQKIDNYKKEKDTNAYSKELIILRKPRPSYTDIARQDGIQGTIKLQVTFLANGQIGSVFLVSPLKGGLNEQAFKAVKKIKFLPAEINGKPVDVTKILEYSFSIY